MYKKLTFNSIGQAYPNKKAGNVQIKASSAHVIMDESFLLQALLKY